MKGWQIAGLLAWMAFWTMIIIRSRLVLKYRLNLIERLHAGADRDIRAGKPWQWRGETFKAVSFNQMVWQFWRRFDSFYPRKDFLS